jgi:hypothetical protein
MVQCHSSSGGLVDLGFAGFDRVLHDCAATTACPAQHSMRCKRIWCEQDVRWVEFTAARQHACPLGMVCAASDVSWFGCCMLRPWYVSAEQQQKTKNKMKRVGKIEVVSATLVAACACCLLLFPLAAGQASVRCLCARTWGRVRNVRLFAAYVASYCRG